MNQLIAQFAAQHGFAPGLVESLTNHVVKRLADTPVTPHDINEAVYDWHQTMKRLSVAAIDNPDFAVTVYEILRGSTDD